MSREDFVENLISECRGAMVVISARERCQPQTEVETQLLVPPNVLRQMNSGLQEAVDSDLLVTCAHF